MSMNERIGKFLAAEAFGVAGASTNRDKFGNKVLRCLLQNGKRVVGINPRDLVIEGTPCVTSVANLPAEVKSLSVITPPAITEQVVEEAIAKGIENIWMQPGAQSPKAIAACEQHGINVIADGSCILVVLGYHDH
jgi:uncharacterized protein